MLVCAVLVSGVFGGVAAYAISRSIGYEQRLEVEEKNRMVSTGVRNAAVFGGVLGAGLGVFIAWRSSRRAGSR